MGFWSTFVGKTIHAVSFGLIGNDGKHHSAPQHPVKLAPTECFTDPDYYMKNIEACNPGMGAQQPTPQLPPPPTYIPPPVTVCTVNCGGSTITPPVSPVPEPEVTSMAIVGALIVGGIAIRRRFKK